MAKITKTKYYSYKIGELAKGCKYCVKGEKSVFFITGVCGCNCFYCPISDAKKNKDVIFINEMPTAKKEEILSEISACSSKGVGITGGDPLCRIDRTIEWIKILKKKFGKSFHIHLYTALDRVNDKVLERLNKAGLDEIRFHPSLESKKYWERLRIATNFKWDIGVEIPAIPKNEKITRELIDLTDQINRDAKNKIKFLNINELEVADNRFNKLIEKGYKTKNDLSYAIFGSEKMALDLMKYISKKKYKLNVHYCTATLKDKVQMAKRIGRRAKNVALPTDIITPQGTLVRGVVYLSEMKPDYGYRKKLKSISAAKRSGYIKRLNRIMKDLKKDFKILKDKMKVDENKFRILTSTETVEMIRDEINECLLKNCKDKKMFGRKDIFLAIVEEYPTYDGFEVEVEFL